MTNNEEPTGPIIVQLAACSACDGVFLMSGRRETSPCHGADPVLVVATLVVQPDASVAGAWGPGPPIGEPDITDSAESPAAAPEEPPAAEEPPPAEEERPDIWELVVAGVANYLGGGEFPAEQVRVDFERMGAEPEAAATAVGRLEAVRGLIRELREQGVPVAAAVTGPETPPAPPEPPSAPEAAPQDA